MSKAKDEAKRACMESFGRLMEESFGVDTVVVLLVEGTVLSLFGRGETEVVAVMRRVFREGMGMDGSDAR